MLSQELAPHGFCLNDPSVGSELMVPVFDSLQCAFQIKSKYYKLGTAVALYELFKTPIVLCDMPGQVDISVQPMLPLVWNHPVNRDFLMEAHEAWVNCFWLFS